MLRDNYKKVAIVKVDKKIALSDNQEFTFNYIPPNFTPKKIFLIFMLEINIYKEILILNEEVVELHPSYFSFVSFSSHGRILYELKSLKNNETKIILGKDSSYDAYATLKEVIFIE